MGGGRTSETTTQIYTPTPPPQPSTAEGIQAYVNALPQIFQAQLDFAPQEAAQQLSLAQQYALPFAQAAKSAQEALYPETTALQEQLAAEAERGISEGISPELIEQYERDIRANLGTNAGSPIGAEFTARSLLGAREDYKRYYRDLALSVAGRQPLAQPVQPQFTNQLQNFTPRDVLGFQAQNYGTFAQAGQPIPLRQSFTQLAPSQQFSNYAGGLGRLFSFNVGNGRIGGP